MTVTEERKEKYDFATYRLDNLALEAPSDSPWAYHDRKDLAGVIENGTYSKALDRWGLGDEAVATSEINPPGWPKV